MQVETFRQVDLVSRNEETQATRKRRAVSTWPKGATHLLVDGQPHKVDGQKVTWQCQTWRVLDLCNVLIQRGKDPKPAMVGLFGFEPMEW